MVYVSLPANLGIGNMIAISSSLNIRLFVKQYLKMCDNLIQFKCFKTSLGILSMPTALPFFAFSTFSLTLPNDISFFSISFSIFESASLSDSVGVTFL